MNVVYVTEVYEYDSHILLHTLMFKSQQTDWIELQEIDGTSAGGWL